MVHHSIAQQERRSKIMKFFKTTLRIWITVTSMAGFLFGWVILAHSPKPVDKTVSAGSNSAQLAPIPSLDALVSQSSGDGSNQQVVGFQGSQNFRPMMRTGGS
jgi:hypothetical protein